MSVASESGYSWHGKEEGLPQPPAAIVMLVSDRGGEGQTRGPKHDRGGVQDQGDPPSTVVAMVVLPAAAVAGGKRLDS